MVSSACLSDPTQKHAYYLSIVGVILEGAFTILGIVSFFVLGSPLLLLYGLQNFVDFFASVVVLWRFFAPGELTKEMEEELNAREDRAAVAISYTIILMGCMVIPAGVADLQAGPMPTEDTTEGLEVIIGFSFASVIIYSTMTALKLYYAKILDSESLHKDGLCSIIGIILSIVILANSWVINQNPDLWEIDAYSAMGCGGLAIVLGLHGILKAIFVKKHDIFSMKFWRNQKDATAGVDDLKLSEENGSKLSDVV